MKKLFKNKNLKNLTTNLIVILLGFLLAVGIFIVYKNNERQKEIAALIPNGKQAFEKEEYSTAIDLFTKAQKEFPDNAEVRRYLGKLYFYKGDYNSAEKQYVALKDKNQLTDEDISVLGNTYLFIRGGEENTIALWKDKTLAAVDSYTLAKLYYKKELYEDYLTELKKIREYKEPAVYLLIQHNNTGTILTDLETTLDLPAITNEEIDLDLFKTQITDANNQLKLSGGQNYNELIQLAAFANLNQCGLLGTRIDALRVNLEKEKLPTYQVDFIKGKCLNQLNKPDQALSLIQTAIQSEVTNTEYRDELAKTYFLKEDIDGVRKTYADIFIIKKNSKLLNNFAGYLYKLNDKNQALEVYTDSLQLAETPNDKNLIAKTILEINFLDQRSLEVCKNQDILDALDISKVDEYTLKSHCDISNNIGIKDFDSSDIKVVYIKALAKKDKVELEKVLDRDKDGFVTTYYDRVGKKLVQ
jgi:Flp pilus assembly protein TadD